MKSEKFSSSPAKLRPFRFFNSLIAPQNLSQRTAQAGQPSQTIW